MTDLGRREMRITDYVLVTAYRFLAHWARERDFTCSSIAHVDQRELIPSRRARELLVDVVRGRISPGEVIVEIRRALARAPRAPRVAPRSMLVVPPDARTLIVVPGASR